MKPFQIWFTRFLLVGSFIVFAAGAAVPASGGVWTATQEEAARWIVAHPGGWAFATTAFIVSIVMCNAGLALFAEHFLQGDAQFLGKAGFYVYLTGALMWILVMGYRLGVIPVGAEFLVENGEVPEFFTPVSLWESAFFDMFETATFLASSIFGLALLKGRGGSNVLGWFAVAYGIFGIVAGSIPIMVLVVPMTLGLSLISRPGDHEES